MPHITSAPLALVVVAVLAYLLGSVPFGIVITRALGLGDLRKIGSGNIGATNVLRTGNKGLAAATLLLDALKGTVAVLVAAYVSPTLGIAAGLGAFLGHLFPVWLGFKGGKGVATYIGVAFPLAWQAGLAFAVIWILLAAALRYSSLAALVATIGTPIVAWLVGKPEAAALLAVMTVIVFIKHRANIQRLLAGTESRIGSKK